MENEKRLIDKKSAWKTAQRIYSDPVLLHAIKTVLDNTPTVQAVEVVHGEWSTIEDDYTGIIALQCSVCNQEYWFEDEPPLKIYNYCPNCGAKKDLKGE